MRHFALTTVFLLLCAFTATAQERIEHVIKKGESIQFIARSYGVSDQDILFWNGLKSAAEAYTGFPLKIYLPANNQMAGSTSESNNYIVRNSNLTEVVHLIHNSNYKKAREVCSNVLSSTNEGNVLYFRGICNLELGDYNDAVKDFERAQKAATLNELFKTDCKTLHDYAQQCKEDRVKKRAHVWGDILGYASATASFALNVAGQSSLSRNVNSLGNSLSKSTKARGNRDNGTRICSTCKGRGWIDSPDNKCTTCENGTVKVGSIN